MARMPKAARISQPDHLILALGRQGRTNLQHDPRRHQFRTPRHACVPDAGFRARRDAVPGRRPQGGHLRLFALTPGREKHAIRIAAIWHRVRKPPTHPELGLHLSQQQKTSIRRLIAANIGVSALPSDTEAISARAIDFDRMLIPPCYSRRLSARCTQHERVLPLTRVAQSLK
jgi:hypothetical protein